MKRSLQIKHAVPGFSFSRESRTCMVSCVCLPIRRESSERATLPASQFVCGYQENFGTVEFPVLTGLKRKAGNGLVIPSVEGEKPLALYVFSRDSAVVERFLSETSSGSACVNDTMFQCSGSDQAGERHHVPLIRQPPWLRVPQGQAQNKHDELEVRSGEIRRSVKLLLALAFLPTNEVPDAFDNIRKTFPPTMDSVSDYFEDTYIGRLPRTNNQLEAWHLAFQSSIQANHPSIYRFIEALRREEALQRMNLVQVRQGRDIVKHQKKYIAVNRRLERVQNSRETYGSRPEYLRAIAANLEVNVV
ncbi:unnamed protein product [Cyprideis torosa]|uniref:Uncharacterized protein n=1 Tax=Cyprideis torosa TaxID=163714 RepID=A0A7R8W9B2_9CRUS|nr:unnamed protein product [Cyprideis torosa]CAG0889569.1 unnamed protein product [Cyprideis torosa]